jgi:hypothetical protein
MQDLLAFSGPPYKSSLYIGIVEDNIDPRKLGRVKVRVQSMFDEIPLADIPWAHPYKDQDGKSFRLPSVGKLVNVVFMDDLHCPYYIYCEHYNFNLLNKLSSLTDDEYKKFSAVYFDDVTQIFTDTDKLMMDYMFNQIEINKSSIKLNLKNNDQTINLGGKDETIILAKKFFGWFDRFINTLLQPQSQLGNLGAPIIKPQIDLLLTEYQGIKTTFLSKHILVTDNYKIPENNENMREIKTSVITDDKLTYNKDKLIVSTAISDEAKDTIKKDFVDKKNDFEKPLPTDGSDQDQLAIYNVTQGINKPVFATETDIEKIEKIKNDLEKNGDVIVDDDKGVIYKTVEQNGFIYNYNTITKKYE